MVCVLPLLAVVTVHSDIARPRLLMVGGGPATASVFVRLAERVGHVGGPVRLGITILDRFGERGGGEPHRSGISSALLLNDPLAEIDSANLGFREWLGAHEADWLPRLRADADPRVRRWVARNDRALTRRELDHLFLPRVLFGEFMRDQVERARATLARAGVETSIETADVVELSPTIPGGAWTARLATG